MQPLDACLDIVGKGIRLPRLTLGLTGTAPSFYGTSTLLERKQGLSA